MIGSWVRTDVAQKIELDIGQGGDAFDLVLAGGEQRERWTERGGKVFTGRDWPYD